MWTEALDGGGPVHAGGLLQAVRDGVDPGSEEQEGEREGPPHFENDDGNQCRGDFEVQAEEGDFPGPLAEEGNGFLPAEQPLCPNS